MNHHRWVERCLAGIAGKAKEKLHVTIFSNLLYGLLVGEAQPLLDEQRTERQTYRLCWSASSGVELRGIFSRSSQGIKDEKITQRLSESNVPPKGTWKSSVESSPLWCFRYYCSAQQL